MTKRSERMFHVKHCETEDGAQKCKSECAADNASADRRGTEALARASSRSSSTPSFETTAEHAAHVHVSGHEHHHHTHAAGSVHAGGHHLLQIDDLSIGFSMYDDRSVRSTRSMHYVIEHLSLSIHEGEVLALVGASGSGKSLLADASLGLFAPNALVTGRIWFDGEACDARTLAQLRGRKMAFVPQSIEALDPLQRVGKQIEGMARGMSKRAARERRRALFARYRLDETAARKYPFELSGGMARRVLLIGALMNSPRVIVADEPTPGLDMELAVRAMDDFRAFASEGGGVLLITHDIELALRVADRIAVFKDGTVVEETATANFASPDLLRHPFSRELWHALPEHDFAAGQPADASEKMFHVKHSFAEKADEAEEAQGVEGPRAACAACDVDAESDRASANARTAHAVPDRAFANACTACAAHAESDRASADARAAHDHAPADVPDRAPATAPAAERDLIPAASSACLEARCVSFGYGGPAPLVFDDFSFAVRPGERVALRAPSGHGKSTLCRLLAGYLEPARGGVFVDGAPLREAAVPGAASPVQLIGQHPERVIDPLLRIRKSLAEAGLGHAGSADDLLAALGVRSAWLDRFPSELSGGELQRICIARALATQPRYLICDEISTMLDASTQAQLWRFLVSYAQEREVGMVIVSHSDALVDRVATRVVEL